MPSIAAYGDAPPDPARQEAVYRQTGMRSTPMTRRVIAGRALIERRTIHIPDIRQAIETDYPDSRFGYALFGQRSQVSVPLLRRGEAIGVLSVYRDEQRAFSDSQIALLETFADQAVIAIENARLFGELQARVGELQALGEVGQAVSSSLDLTEVLTTIVINATHLAGADGGIVYEYDEAEDVFEVRAADQLADDLSESLRTARFRLGEGAVGRAAAARAG